MIAAASPDARRPSVVCAVCRRVQPDAYCLYDRTALDSLGRPLRTCLDCHARHADLERAAWRAARK